MQLLSVAMFPIFPWIGRQHFSLIFFLTLLTRHKSLKVLKHNWRIFILLAWKGKTNVNYLFSVSLWGIKIATLNRKEASVEKWRNQRKNLPLEDD